MRLLLRILMRLALPVLMGGVYLAWQATGGPAAALLGRPAPGGQTIDPQAEADRVAAILRDMGASLRNGTPPGPVPGAISAGPPPPPAPSFTAAPAPRQTTSGDRPRILNGGGAGSFHRAPQPER